MATLLFFDDGHRYELDGVEVPSVSELTRFLSREVYQDIQQYRLDNAAGRGTRVHKATEQLDRLGDCEVDTEIEPYVRAYIKFRQEHACEWSGIEKPCVNEQLRYAGTMDRIGTLDGKPAILDIKAQSTVHKVLVANQLNAYLLCQSEPHELYCLQLMQTGKYRLYPVSVNPEGFMACYTLDKQLKQKFTKGMIDL